MARSKSPIRYITLIKILCRHYRTKKDYIRIHAGTNRAVTIQDMIENLHIRLQVVPTAIPNEISVKVVDYNTPHEDVIYTRNVKNLHELFKLLSKNAKAIQMEICAQRLDN